MIRIHPSWLTPRPRPERKRTSPRVNRRVWLRLRGGR